MCIFIRFDEKFVFFSSLGGMWVCVFISISRSYAPLPLIRSLFSAHTLHARTHNFFFILNSRKSAVIRRLCRFRHFCVTVRCCCCCWRWCCCCRRRFCCCCCFYQPGQYYIIMFVVMGYVLLLLPLLFVSLLLLLLSSRICFPTLIPYEFTNNKLSYSIIVATDLIICCCCCRFYTSHTATHTTLQHNAYFVIYIQMHVCWLSFFIQLLSIAPCLRVCHSLFDK